MINTLEKQNYFNVINIYLESHHVFDFDKLCHPPGLVHPLLNPVPSGFYPGLKSVVYTQ